MSLTKTVVPNYFVMVPKEHQSEACAMRWSELNEAAPAGRLGLSFVDGEKHPDSEVCLPTKSPIANHSLLRQGGRGWPADKTLLCQQN